jgi:hypothetical protein
MLRVECLHSALITCSRHTLRYSEPCSTFGMRTMHECNHQSRRKECGYRSGGCKSSSFRERNCELNCRDQCARAF